MKGFHFFERGLAIFHKHLETIVIFSMLTIITTIFIYLVIMFKPSISAFRIVIITLGSTMIGSVLICLLTGYIRSHSYRKFIFPVTTQPIRAQNKCNATPFSQETLDESLVESISSPFNVIAINSE